MVWDVCTSKKNEDIKLTHNIHMHYLINTELYNMYITLTSNSPNNIAQTNVKLANINKLPPNAPKLNGVIRCTLPACKKREAI